VLLVAAAFLARSLLLTPRAHPSGSPPKPSVVATVDGPAAAAPTPTPGGTTSPTGPESPFPTTPILDPAVFVQRGALVAVATTVRNPNAGYGLESFSVTFVVQDVTGNRLARSTTKVALPPMAVVRAVVGDIRIHPKEGRVDSVFVQFGPVVWTPAASYPASGLQIDGAGLSSSGPDSLTVVASVSNLSRTEQSGRLVCEIEDAAGGLTGAVAAHVSLRARQDGPIEIPVPHPARDARVPACEIVPEGH